MQAGQFIEVNPVLPVRKVTAAIAFYTQKLGFSLRFQDDPQHPRYAVVERDAVRLHLQEHATEHFRENVEVLHLRFMIEDVDGLYAEYQGQDVFHARTTLADTPWGTREFAFYDLDGNGLFFYRYRNTTPA